MIRFIGKRILQMIPVVLLVATLIFGILYLVPGDPAQIMLGSTASEYELAEMREQLGLDHLSCSLENFYQMYFFILIWVNLI